VGPARQPHPLPSSPPFSHAALHRFDRPVPRPHARGRDGRAAELARTPVNQPGRFCKGELPLLPSPDDAKGARAATGGWPRRRPGASSNWGARPPIYPCAPLTETLKGGPGTLAAPHRPNWGFSPLPVCAAARGEREWRREGDSRAPRCRRRAAARGRP
jgi:hypothetical protein